MIGRLIVTGVLLISAGMTWAEPPLKPVYPPLTPVIANMGQGCRIKIHLPAQANYKFNYAGYDDKGNINPSWLNGSLGFNLFHPPHLNDYWNLGFTCYSKDAELAKDDLIVWGETAERWIPNPDGWPVPPAMRFTIYEIKTPNASGWAHTTDDTAVAEERAERRLRYCIFHDERAICGGSTVGNLLTISRHPLADRTPYVLKILRSIEFLDDAPPESAQPPK